MKLFLCSYALGTLQSMDLLKKWGLEVPKKLKDILAADEAMFKKESEDMEVEEITEHNLSLSPLRIEQIYGFGQFGSKMGMVDSATVASLRSPQNDHYVAALVSSTAARSRIAGLGDPDVIARQIPNAQAQEPAVGGRETSTTSSKEHGPEGEAPDASSPGQRLADQSPN